MNEKWVEEQTESFKGEIKKNIINILIRDLTESIKYIKTGDLETAYRLVGGVKESIIIFDNGKTICVRKKEND